eukprot:1434347-Alexandrium_andersonii.AAC.1
MCIRDRRSMFRVCWPPPLQKVRCSVHVFKTDVSTNGGAAPGEAAECLGKMEVDIGKGLTSLGKA